MIEGYVGLMGSGKTYAATRRAGQALREGRLVLANYQIEGALYWADWGEMFDFSLDIWTKREKGLIIVDEANIMLPSRVWQKMDPRLLMFWAQSRKIGVDVIWTAQHESRVDTSVREITYQIWRCRKYGKLFQTTAYLPEALRKEKGRPIKRSFFFRREWVCTLYDTYQIISPPANLQRVAVEGFSRAPSFRDRPVEEVGILDSRGKRRHG